MRKIILASQSPRRRELMEQAGFEFDIIPSKMEEKITKTIPYEVVEELASQKALDVYNMCDDKDALVIGADTIVAIDGKILGKPKSEEEAINMLRGLSGRTHEVYTGVSFVWSDMHNGEENDVKDSKNSRNLDNANCIHTHTFYECTRVTFYEMSDEEIRSYVSSGDPMDKAGSYGIQGRCAIYIKGIEGDYNNVVGLPISRLYQELKEKMNCR